MGAQNLRPGTGPLWPGTGNFDPFDSPDFSAGDGKGDAHIVLLRMNDGVTLSADDLVALPETEAMTKATVAGETLAVRRTSSRA